MALLSASKECKFNQLERSAIDRLMLVSPTLDVAKHPMCRSMKYKYKNSKINWKLKKLAMIRLFFCTKTKLFATQTKYKDSSLT